MRKMGKHYVALHLRYALEASYIALHFSNNCGVIFVFVSIPCIADLIMSRDNWDLHQKEILLSYIATIQTREMPTPEEVGLMLRALGYSKDVHLYVASGEVYGGD
ncbi:hypothetical protein Tco_1194444 [Tanacetum coccineum]